MRNTMRRAAAIFWKCSAVCMEQFVSGHYRFSVWMEPHRNADLPRYGAGQACCLAFRPVLGSKAM